MSALISCFQTGKLIGSILSFVLAVACGLPIQAAEIYHIDFSEPSAEYQVVAGNPTVAATAGSLQHALIFHAVAGSDQIQLPIGLPGPRYELQFDLLPHNISNSDYAFFVSLESASARSLRFHGGLNAVYLYQSTPFQNLELASLADDMLYHVGIVMDSTAGVWSVALNGTTAFTGTPGGDGLENIRFGMAPWIGGAINAPQTYAALDNVVVTVVPEPSAMFLFLGASATWLRWQRVQKQIH